MRRRMIQIAEHFGMCHQQSKAIEEYAEVIHVISRIQIEGVSVELRESLIEELADAEVMKEQLMLFHEITDEEIEEIKREKIKRTMNKYEIGRTNMKDRLILICGASGSGKTTIARELEKEKFNIIHSYTTRKPREENEWGHIFLQDWLPVYVDGIIVAFEDVKGETIDIDEMIAYKNLYGEHYFATKEQYQGKGVSIYIVDPDGAEQVKRNVKDAEVVTILLNADEAVRDYRMGNTRETNDRMQRLIKDREIFKVVKCDYAVDANRDVEEVLTDIVGIIDDQDVY